MKFFLFIVYLYIFIMVFILSFLVKEIYEHFNNNKPQIEKVIINYDYDENICNDENKCIPLLPPDLEGY
ncbi:unnamed protein product, partial [marine sediment metagenome]